MVAQYPESDLTSAFDTSYEASAQDRGVLLKAMQELKSRGWMDLIEVMGPWSWQPRQALRRLGADGPGRKSLHEVRAIRDEIDSRVQALLAELVPSRIR